MQCHDDDMPYTRKYIDVAKRRVNVWTMSLPSGQATHNANVG